MPFGVISIYIKKLSMPLYIIATPIGNLEDITLRALKLLKIADIILCEHPVHSQKLLQHYGIAVKITDHYGKTRSRLLAYHQHNEKQHLSYLLQALKSEKIIVLISDSGMPLLSDPGFLLAKAARANGCKVSVIPGASAITTALAGSGLEPLRFSFFGFPPTKKTARNQFWHETRNEILGAVIIFLPPHKAVTYITELALLDANRIACLAREMTKIHEEFVILPLQKLLEWIKKQQKLRGEMVLILNRYSDVTEDSDKKLQDMLRFHYRSGKSLKTAVAEITTELRQAQQGRKPKKSDIYKKALTIWQKL